MVIKQSEMRKEFRERMRGGDGTVEIVHLAGKEIMKNCRLMAQLIIPPGAGIGDHEHLKETEYFIITEGQGTVHDEGQDTEIRAGDIVVTGDGGSHSIRNTGDTPLKLYAVIITE